MREAILPLVIVALLGCQAPEADDAQPSLGKVSVHVDSGIPDSMWADVYVDGHFIGNYDENMAIPLPPGEHAIRVELEGYVAVERCITVLPESEDQWLHLRLKPES